MKIKAKPTSNKSTVYENSGRWVSSVVTINPRADQSAPHQIAAAGAVAETPALALLLEYFAVMHLKKSLHTSS